MLAKLKEAVSKISGNVAPKVSKKPQVKQSVPDSSSVFKNNFSSITVLNKKPEISQIKPTKTVGHFKTGGEKQMETLISGIYGDKLDDGQKSSIAYSIVDNNRWMIDDINETYLAKQIAEDIGDIEEEEQEEVSDITSLILSADEPLDFDKLQNDSDYSSLRPETWEKLKTVQAKFFSIDENSAYEQFSEDVRTDSIPVDLIYDTDFSDAHPNEAVFCPEINTLEDNNTSGEIQTSEIYASEDEMSLNIKDLPKDEAKAMIAQALAQNYGLEELNGAQEAAVLHALFLEEENNGIFDDKNENLDEIYDYIIQSADEEGNILLTCPDITLSTNGAVDDVEGSVSYLHMLKNDTSIQELRELTGKQQGENILSYDILKLISYKDTNLQDALNNAQPNTDEYNEIMLLATTSLQQIIASNPALYSRFGNNLTQNQLLYLNLSDVLASDDTIVLEDAAYIYPQGERAINEPPVATNTPQPTGTPIATSTPTPTATAAPTPTATATPTATPTATATPTPKPTATPTPKPTATPTAKPTATPTPKPTATPTPKPTATPTAKPTATPTPKPTATPTAKPTPTCPPLPEETKSPDKTPSVATPNPTQKPQPTSTPKPQATATPKPQATATPKPQATKPCDDLPDTGRGDDSVSAATPKPTQKPQQEAPQQEAQKTEAPKQEAPKQEAQKTEAPKQEAPKQEAPKQEAPKQEAPKEEESGDLA